jgi:hypothetical protein
VDTILKISYKILIKKFFLKMTEAAEKKSPLFPPSSLVDAFDGFKIIEKLKINTLEEDSSFIKIAKIAARFFVSLVALHFATPVFVFYNAVLILTKFVCILIAEARKDKKFLDVDQKSYFEDIKKHIFYGMKDLILKTLNIFFKIIASLVYALNPNIVKIFNDYSNKGYESINKLLSKNSEPEPAATIEIEI